MSERVSSTLILLGGGLLALWVLSALVVHWDTGRRKMGKLERRAWLALSIFAPLFGFVIYLAIQTARGYLSLPAREVSGDEEARLTAVKPDPRYYADHPPLPKTPAEVPEPAWGRAAGKGSNGRQAPQPQGLPSSAAQRPLRAGYTLAVVKGPHQGQQFFLDRLPARIGRGPDAAVALDADLNVSRSHAEIYEWNGRLRIRDLQSSHGTRINERTAADQAISPGDRIAVGNSVLILQEIR